MNDIRITVEKGKYTFCSTIDGSLYILRDGEHWRTHTGDKALLALMHAYQKLEEDNTDLKEQLADTKADPNDEELLAEYGWSIDCISPFEISHEESGDKATGHAAWMVVQYLRANEDS